MAVFLFYIFPFISFFSFLPAPNVHETGIPVCHGRCTGSAYCTACTNCKYCKYCNSGGTCGVCASVPVKSRNTEPTYNTNKRPAKVRESFNSNENLYEVRFFIVVSRKAYFYHSPDKTDARRDFLISGDKGQIIAYSKEFVYTKYHNSKGTTTKGWIRKDDIIIE